ncbi:MAG: hypothetical protein ACXIVF_15400 [Rhizobiaceae bacterium]
MKISFSGIESIRPGFPLELRLTYPEAFFEAELMGTGRLIAHVRRAVPAELSFALDSNAGTIQRELNTLVLHMPADDTARLSGGIAVFDFVRVAEDGTRRAIPGRWVWPVHATVTRDLDETPGGGAATKGVAAAHAVFEMPSHSGQVEFGVAVVPGPQGRSFLTGEGAPGSDLGKPFDVYVDHGSGYYYQRAADDWGAPIANFFGGALDAAEATEADREAVAQDRAAVEALKAQIDPIAPKVVALADEIGALTSVAGQIAAVGTVSGQIDAVMTVANGMAQVALVAGIFDHVEAVSEIAPQVVAVAGNEPAISLVATKMPTIEAVSDDLSTLQSAMVQMATAYADSQTRYIDAFAFA